MVYLDHAATTPIRPEVVAAMAAEMGVVGNASSLHTSGRRARRIVEEAREEIAEALGASPAEVIFTSGGTESNNLAIKGIFWARRDADKQRQVIAANPTEHHAVLDALEWLVAHEQAEVHWLDVDSVGRVNPAELAEILTARPNEVALVTVMTANNEVGTVQPIAELADIASQFDVPFHTDAVQAVGAVPIRFSANGFAGLSMTGHKLGGPLGAGVLLLSRRTSCVPLLHGGGHERNVRSGTLDVPAIVGLAVAVRLAIAEQAATVRQLSALQTSLINGIQQAVPSAILTGDPVNRLPGNVHFCFPGCEGDSLLLLLDDQGVECSTGSACSAGVTGVSHVLRAMGIEDRSARGALRFSLGRTTVQSDVDHVVNVIGSVVERARHAGMVNTAR